MTPNQLRVFSIICRTISEYTDNLSEVNISSGSNQELILTKLNDFGRSRIIVDDKGNITSIFCFYKANSLEDDESTMSKRTKKYDQFMQTYKFCSALFAFDLLGNTDKDNFDIYLNNL